MDLFSLLFTLCLLLFSITQINLHPQTYIHTQISTPLLQLQNVDIQRHTSATEAASPTTETVHHHKDEQRCISSELARYQ